jgi:hypothetical protein
MASKTAPPSILVEKHPISVFETIPPLNQNSNCVLFPEETAGGHLFA